MHALGCKGGQVMPESHAAGLTAAEKPPWFSLLAQTTTYREPTVDDIA